MTQAQQTSLLMGANVTSRRQLLTYADCAHCALCPKDGHIRPVFGMGAASASTTARLVLVGEAPGQFEVRSGRVFSGDTGEILFSSLHELGITDPRDVWLDNALLCAPSTASGARKVSTGEIAACRTRLFAMLDQLQAKRVIVCMGASAAQSLVGKKVSITQLNGKAEWHPLLQCFVVYTYNPAVLFRRPDLYQDYRHAMRRAVELLDAEAGEAALDVTPTERYTPESIDDACVLVYDLLAHLDTHELVIACDIESENLRLDAEILEVGFSWEEGRAIVLPREQVYDPKLRYMLRELFLHDNVTWVWHNGKFDVQRLRRDDFAARIDADTMLLHYALDERAAGSTDASGVTTQHGGGYHDLKSIAQKYCNAPEWSTEVEDILRRKKSMKMVPTEMRRDYHAYDCDYTRRLYFVLTRELQREPKSRAKYPMPLEMHNTVLVPIANALADIESRGIAVGDAPLRELSAHYHTLLEQVQDRAMLYAEPYTFTWDKEFNPGSPAQVSEILYTGMGFTRAREDENEEAQFETTEEAALNALKKQPGHPEDHRQFIDAILGYRGYQKIIRTYIVGVTKNMTADNRLHTSLSQHTTTTGRLSSREPNLQNIPKHSILRNMFVASDGYTLCEADYSQLEIRAATYLARDTRMRDDVLTGDYHWATAHTIFGDTVNRMEAARAAHDLDALETLCAEVSTLRELAALQRDTVHRITSYETLYQEMKETIRRNTKFVNFGVMYGREAESMANPETGLGVPISDARKFIQNWRKRYPVLYAYMRQQAKYAQDERFVESYFGRRRRFPFSHWKYNQEIANQALNMPVQSFASDICLLSLVTLHRELEARELGHIILTVHDSILFELVTARLAEACVLIEHVMTHTLANSFIPFDVDMKVGPDWGHLAKYELQEAA